MLKTFAQNFAIFFRGSILMGLCATEMEGLKRRRLVGDGGENRNQTNYL